MIYPGATQWVPHICPVLADMGAKNPGRPVLYQGTNQRVPHICLPLADVGFHWPTHAAICFVSGRDFTTRKKQPWLARVSILRPGIRAVFSKPATYRVRARPWSCRKGTNNKGL
jgi:hypothetical protein